MVYFRPLLYSMLLVAGVVHADSCKNDPEHIVYPQKASLPDSQTLNSSSFIGSPVNTTSLKPLFKLYPEASLIHGNGGDSGTSDDPGPSGINPNVSSVANSQHDGVGIRWQLDWWLYQHISWKVSGSCTKDGHIYVVHPDIYNGNPYFTTVRTIDLASTMQTGEQLLNAMYDTAGNMWFITGGTINGGDSPQLSLTFGYTTPQGKIVRNGMNVYMVTGPTDTTNTSNGTGYMYSMTSDRRHRGIRINWRVPYTADSGKETGSAPRGSGSSPALITDKYVVITDRSTPRVNLNGYPACRST
ncbi:hypothetical protein EK21DRAFT_89781 [Setomelanomma holmii]|uniref:Uncharacterized protein n=1 Tax=Setomelanomma holmii TaxID=210430 RepID=A0A9P4H8Z3_9PLEO|nr:hypothetical protein EK21DRAFT_89781 [Setomelanomma holmii]